MNNVINQRIVRLNVFAQFRKAARHLVFFKYSHPRRLKNTYRALIQWLSATAQTKYHLNPKEVFELKAALMRHYLGKDSGKQLAQRSKNQIS